MKDKRNCAMPYPIYPQPMMPMNMMNSPMTYPGYNQGYTANSISSNTIEQQMNNIEQQIRELDQRVNRLESMNNINTNNNKYNNSNYYMV